jgi:hypothetical protein
MSDYDPIMKTYKRQEMCDNYGNVWTVDDINMVFVAARFLLDGRTDEIYTEEGLLFMGFL